MTIAVLAVQGAFAEHEQMLERLGVPYVELRKKTDLLQEYDGIILPGGESILKRFLLPLGEMLMAGSWEVFMYRRNGKE